VVQAGPGTKRDSILKITKAERAGSAAQVVECLLSKCKTLSSTPLLSKGKKKLAWFQCMDRAANEAGRSSHYKLNFVIAFFFFFCVNHTFFFLCMPWTFLIIQCDNPGNLVYPHQLTPAQSSLWLLICGFNYFSKTSFVKSVSFVMCVH
jgi:hypothetical protein